MLFTKLPRIVFCDSLPSSFELKRGILPVLMKEVFEFEDYLPDQVEFFLVIKTFREHTLCEISHICPCDFKDKSSLIDVYFFLFYQHIFFCF